MNQDSFYTCANCGNIFCSINPISLFENTFCSYSCYNEYVEKYNPSLYEGKNDYPIVRYRMGYRKSYSTPGTVPAHRLVAERMLKRKLNRREVVHHIDGDKKNFNEDNLIVFNTDTDHRMWHILGPTKAKLIKLPNGAHSTMPLTQIIDMDYYLSFRKSHI